MASNVDDLCPCAVGVELGPRPVSPHSVSCDSAELSPMISSSSCRLCCSSPRQTRIAAGILAVVIQSQLPVPGAMLYPPQGWPGPMYLLRRMLLGTFVACRKHGTHDSRGFPESLVQWNSGYTSISLLTNCRAQFHV
jgi:hypothetical protein